MDSLSIAVLERNDFTGGRCSLLYDKDGHRFDAGPSLLLLPKLFEEAFKDLGTTMKEEINIVKCGERNFSHKLERGSDAGDVVQNRITRSTFTMERNSPSPPTGQR